MELTKQDKKHMEERVKRIKLRVVDEAAECIFDWWVSGLPYRKWRDERFRQRRLEFFEEDFKR